MHTVKVVKVEKIEYDGPVYNIELLSEDENIKNDDLFWVEGESGIVTHNCLPKDTKAMAALAEKLNTTVKFFKYLEDENQKYPKTAFPGMRKE